MAEPKLIDADLPLVLLPVRLETRFFGSQLRVRVYPDDLHIDTHEPELTEAELQWGRHFYELLWRAADDEARKTAAWGQLADRFGTERATWVAFQLTPVNETDRPQSSIPATTPLPKPPKFPTVLTRPENEKYETWTRPPVARGLPDRWIASAIIGGKIVATATGQPIPELLPAGPNPRASILEVEGQLPLDEGMKWIIDFDEAENLGMALRLELPPLIAGLPRKVDRLIVFGVKTYSDLTTSTARLTDLLKGHQFTEGLSLLAQGTPTNNTDEVKSGFSSGEGNDLEPNAHRVMGEPLFQRGDRSDGDELCTAMGLPIEILARTAGSGNHEHQDSYHMNRALWPATWGYYLEQMMNGIFPDGEVYGNLDWGRTHFVNYVRPGGPLPSLRIGTQPYGLLPVTSLESWKPVTTDDSQDTGLVDFLNVQKKYWLELSQSSSRIGRTSDPDKDFIDVFSMDALSSTYAVRNVMGEKYAHHLFGLLGTSVVPLPGRIPTNERWQWQHTALAQVALGRTGIGPEGMNARLAMALHAAQSDALKVLPLIQAESQGELVPNYIRWLLSAPNLQAIVDNVLPPETDKPFPFSMLYLLLRHSLLLEYTGASARKLNLKPNQRHEPEHIGFKQLDAGKTLLDRIKDAKLHTGDAFFAPTDPQLSDFRDSLNHLAALPAERLNILLRGTLDLSSHRLDAWITSFATKRLKTMRHTNPEGIYLGGYGWLENILAAPPPQTVPAPSGESAPVTIAPNDPGFVHTPSLAQAATVAVLRSGHLSHASDDKPDLLAIDLSSQRARLTQWLLDGVKAGQPLGALLGYRFERGLHEHHPELSRLDRFISPLRELAPLTSVPLGQVGQEMAESIPVSHVVDGLKLYRRWQKKNPGAPEHELIHTLRERSEGATKEEIEAIEFELHALENAVDAVSDALLAESVHQSVRGNPTRAATTLDALERGDAPLPQLEVLRTPRSGSAFTHRVIVLCSNEAPTKKWPGSAALPRALAEPQLNAWATNLLGNPANVRCRIEQLDPETGQLTMTREFLLSKLGISPLDVLYAPEAAEGSPQSELEQRILYAARRAVPGLPPNTLLRLNPLRDPAWPIIDLSWMEFSELARTVRRLIFSARPLQAADLLSNATPSTETTDVADLKQRADLAVLTLRKAQTALRLTLDSLTASSLDALRKHMLGMAHFGIPGSVPLSVSGKTEDDFQSLLLQGQSVDKDASERLAKIAESEEALGEPNITNESRIALHQERMRHVFGESFVVLPRFRPPDATSLERALSASTQVQDGDPFAVITFHQRIARVREAVTHLDDMLRLAEALGTGDSLSLEVMQLPYYEKDRWIGLAAKPDIPPGAGRLSLITHLTGSIDFTQPLTGLMIDEWVEVVPNKKETTGVVFQYNQPDSCPPQAILLAVPPNPVEQNFWTTQSLLQVLQETLDLVHMRSVTPALLDEIGQYLPALYFSLNASGDTISTDFLNPGAPNSSNSSEPLDRPLDRPDRPLDHG